MTTAETDYLSTVRQMKLSSPGLTETEMVLKYWEYMHSPQALLPHRTTPNDNKFKYDCNRENLIEILRFLNRSDAAELVEKCGRVGHVYSWNPLLHTYNA